MSLIKNAAENIEENIDRNGQLDEGASTSMVEQGTILSF